MDDADGDSDSYTDCNVYVDDLWWTRNAVKFLACHADVDHDVFGDDADDVVVVDDDDVDDYSRQLYPGTWWTLLASWVRTAKGSNGMKQHFWFQRLFWVETIDLPDHLFNN